MTILRRTLVVLASVVAVTFGLQGVAYAQTCNVVQSGPFEPGDSFTVIGESFTALENVNILLNGDVAGTGQVDVNGEFSVASQVPPFTNPGVYQVSAQTTTDSNVGCESVLVEENGDDNGDDDNGDDDNGDDEEQETLDDILDAIEALDSATPAPPAAPAAPQQQQQQQIVPASFGGASLPKTGTEVMDLGGVAVALLMVGGSLMRLGRDRVRRYRSRGHDHEEPTVADDDFITPSF